MRKKQTMGSVGLRRGQDMALLPALSIEQMMEVVRATAKDFEECCDVAPSYASISWWTRGIARLLSDQGLTVVTDARNRTFRHDLGSFYRAVRSDFEMGVDVLACEKWSRHRLGHEDYGQDEEFLPAFHAVRIVCNDLSGWGDFFDIAKAVDGPLTITVVGINVFAGGEGYSLAAEKFEREMTELKLTHAISTKSMNPGLFASVTVWEPLEPFQLLVASKTLQRPALRNPDVKNRD